MITLKKLQCEGRLTLGDTIACNNQDYEFLGVRDDGLLIMLNQQTKQRHYWLVDFGKDVKVVPVQNNNVILNR